jgi:hypothetical protein
MASEVVESRAPFSGTGGLSASSSTASYQTFALNYHQHLNHRILNCQSVLTIQLHHSYGTSLGEPSSALARLLGFMNSIVDE